MSNRPLKRARTTFQVSQKRPIDKSLINVAHDLNTTQQSTVLTTATFPCTITGIRWALSLLGDASGPTTVRWAIVLVKDGNSANTMASSDGSTLYEPEQNVLAFGVKQLQDLDQGAGPGAISWEGSTKTMRKLMGGDQLVLITIVSTTRGDLSGVVQFFCKS